jgi:pyruvate/2-oxoglutarate dehydrogenase complex dihydrolipoamide dehydrogenase (E3) component
VSKYDYNVIVIGGGTAGLISAYVANLLGAKVALVEGKNMGGDCLNTGCVPSKSLIASAHAAAHVKSAADYGVQAAFGGVDYGYIQHRIQDIIADIEPNDSAERYRNLGIDVFEATASWVDGHTIALEDKVITARRIVIASGSRPRLPKIPGIEFPHVYTSDSIWGLSELPKRLVILGGGPIGSELAMAYAQLGSQVTLVENGPHILSLLSSEQAEIVQTSMRLHGITIICNAKAGSITKDSVIVSPSTTIKADAVLAAIGRTPNTQWLGDSGIALDDQGYIVVNKALRTNLKSVYACGDVTGGYQFTHVAAYEAGFAGSNAALDWTRFYRKPRYDGIPWTIFTTPEVAHVGLAVGQIDKTHTVTHLDVSEVDRAKTDGQHNGGIWLIADRKGKLVGSTIITNQAASLIGEATLAITQKLSVKAVFETIHVYPSYGELYTRASAKWRQEAVNKKLLALLKPLLARFR